MVSITFWIITYFILFFLTKMNRLVKKLESMITQQSITNPLQQSGEYGKQAAEVGSK